MVVPFTRLSGDARLSITLEGCQVPVGDTLPSGSVSGRPSSGGRYRTATWTPAVRPDSRPVLARVPRPNSRTVGCCTEMQTSGDVAELAAGSESDEPSL